MVRVRGQANASIKQEPFLHQTINQHEGPAYRRPQQLQGNRRGELQQRIVEQHVDRKRQLLKDSVLVNLLGSKTRGDQARHNRSLQCSQLDDDNNTINHSYLYENTKTFLCFTYDKPVQPDSYPREYLKIITGVTSSRGNRGGFHSLVDLPLETGEKEQVSLSEDGCSPCVHLELYAIGQSLVRVWQHLLGVHSGVRADNKYVIFCSSRDVVRSVEKAFIHQDGGWLGFQEFRKALNRLLNCCPRNEVIFQLVGRVAKKEVWIKEADESDEAA